MQNFRYNLKKTIHPSTIKYIYMYIHISEERFTVLITSHIKLYYFLCRYVTTGIELAKKASADLGWGGGWGVRVGGGVGSLSPENSNLLKLIFI